MKPDRTVVRFAMLLIASLSLALPAACSSDTGANVDGGGGHGGAAATGSGGGGAGGTGGGSAGGSGGTGGGATAGRGGGGGNAGAGASGSAGTGGSGVDDAAAPDTGTGAVRGPALRPAVQQLSAERAALPGRDRLLRREWRLRHRLGARLPVTA